MIKNLYYIIKLPDHAIDGILKYTIEKGITNTRKSNDGKFAVVKLPVGAEIPQAFQNLQSYTHSEILQILNTDLNWNELM